MKINSQLEFVSTHYDQSTDHTNTFTDTTIP